MTDLIASDVSEWQVPVNDAYPHRWLIFRLCDGTYVDRNAAANLAWAKRAVKDGRLDGYTGYAVYRPNTPTLQTLMRVVGEPDTHLTVMIDVESWKGAITGNHSLAITALANGVGEWLGDRRRVLAYGNHGDLVSLYPVRPAWLRFIVASYGTQQPAFPNMIGWQYSDGDTRWPVPTGLPRKSKPFGACDHNVFPGLTSAELATELGVGDDMPLSDADKAWMKANLGPVAVWSKRFKDPTDPTGKRTYSAATYLVYGNLRAKQALSAVKTVAVDASIVAADITTRVRTNLAAMFGGPK